MGIPAVYTVVKKAVRGGPGFARIIRQVSAGPCGEHSACVPPPPFSMYVPGASCLVPERSCSRVLEASSSLTPCHVNTDCDILTKRERVTQTSNLLSLIEKPWTRHIQPEAQDDCECGPTQMLKT